MIISFIRDYSITERQVYFYIFIWGFLLSFQKDHALKLFLKVINTVIYVRVIDKPHKNGNPNSYQKYTHITNHEAIKISIIYDNIRSIKLSYYSKIIMCSVYFFICKNIDVTDQGVGKS